MALRAFRVEQPSPLSNSRTFPSPQRETPNPSWSLPAPHWQPGICLVSASGELAALDTSRARNQTLCSPCDGLPSLSVLFSGYIRVAACVSPSVLSVVGQYSSVWIGHILFILHQLVDPWVLGFVLRVLFSPYKMSQRLYRVGESHSSSVLLNVCRLYIILSHSFLCVWWLGPLGAIGDPRLPFPSPTSFLHGVCSA